MDILYRNVINSDFSMHFMYLVIQGDRKFPLQTSRVCRGDWVDNFLQNNHCPETNRFRATGKSSHEAFPSPASAGDKWLVIETPVDTVEDLVARVLTAAQEIQQTQGVMERVYQNLIRRYTVCNEVHGRHIEPLL